MQKQKDVLVVGAARTAVGSFGGALKDVALADLATSRPLSTPATAP